MEKNNLTWIENVEKLPDRCVIKFIKGLSRRITYLISLEELEDNIKIGVISDLEARKGVLIEEAETRGLNYA